MYVLTKKRTNRNVSGARYSTFSQIANVCPLVSMQEMVWYSVWYWGELWDLEECERRSALTLSARPPSPAARKRSFFRRLAAPVDVADAVTLETAPRAKEPGVSATWIGMV